MRQVAYPCRSHRGAGLEGAPMSEVIFIVEEAPEGGYTARALGEAVFTEADTIAQIEDNVRDAVRCHFEDGHAPRVIRLHFVQERVIGL